MYYVYVLRCVDDTIYCGTASDWQRRLSEHAAGGRKSARYTRAHPPRRLEALWECEEQGDALRLEYRFKQLRRADKERLISSEEYFSELLPVPEQEKYRRQTDAAWVNNKLS